MLPLVRGGLAAAATAARGAGGGARWTALVTRGPGLRGSATAVVVRGLWWQRLVVDAPARQLLGIDLRGDGCQLQRRDWGRSSSSNNSSSRWISTGRRGLAPADDRDKASGRGDADARAEAVRDAEAEANDQAEREMKGEEGEGEEEEEEEEDGDGEEDSTEVEAEAEGPPPHVNLRMPQISPDCNYGHLTRWHVEEGDMVKAGDPICEVETEYFTVEIDAEEDQYVAKLLYPAGQKNVHANDKIAILVRDEAHVASFEDEKPEQAGVLQTLSEQADEEAAEAAAEEANQALQQEQTRERDQKQQRGSGGDGKAHARNGKGR